ncbi:hypothetical protein F5877DRAFT_79583 [Lentinula edodes]|nr:hypothetical protein F5877DRAFT_79583 [Lentinula edodes]
MGHSVPLLLESFPVPPSFLPPSTPRTPSSLSFNHANIGEPINEPSSSISSTSSIPPSSSVSSISSTSSNPPPSLPPRGPLPPVPGRSRISDHEAAHLLQSRRSSKYSINSSHSGNGGYDRPDSVASFASARSNGASYAYGHGYRDLETREGRRVSKGSGRVKPPEVQVTTEDAEDTNQAYGGLRIDEEDDSDVQLTSLRLSISPMPPSPTDTDNELEIPSSLSTQFPTPPPLSPFALQQANAMQKRIPSSAASTPIKWSAPPSPLYQPSPVPPPVRSASPNESLAEISMHDLPSGDDGAESEWDVPTTKPPVVQAFQTRRVSGGGVPPPSSFTTSVPSRSESRSSLRRMARISMDNLDNVSLKASIISPSVSISPSKSIGSTYTQPDPSPSMPSPPATFPTPPTTYPTPPSSSATYSPDVEIDLHRSLHRELRSARSRSRSHRERLISGIASPSSPPADVAWPPMPPVPYAAEFSNRPRRKASQASTVSVADNQSTADSDDGRASPDVQRLLEKTPRPRRSLSMKRRTRSSIGTSSTKGSIGRRKSGGVGSDDGYDEFGGPSLLSRGRKESRRRLGHNEDVEAKLQKLERELDGRGSESEGENVPRRHSYGDGFGFGTYKDGVESDGDGSDSDASDSSLDLHTPLPNLMLRHGLLSANSKLLPASASVDSLASVGADGGARPGSMMSMTSNTSIQTKSGLFKDTRDTSSRRLRHKDGRLLRGGIGLTTGLGWSDSEDEGAPSALTRRLSSLNLSRNSSSASLVSSRMRSKSYGNLRASASMPSVSRPSPTTGSSTFSHSSRSNYNPLSRSFSSRTLDIHLDEVDEISEFGEMNVGHGKGSNVPPTLRSTKKSFINGETRSIRSSSSTLSMKTSISHLTSGERTPKTSGAGNRFARPGSEASTRSSASDVAGSTSRYGVDELAILTPSSTASSLSIPLTPRDDDDILEDTQASSLTGRSHPNIDKMLPSLPNPKTGSIRRPSAPSSIRKSSLKKPLESSSYSTHSFPSIASDTSINSTPSSSLNSTSPTAMTSPRPLKQLQLPRQQSVMNVNGQLPVPVPSLNGGSSRLRMPSTPSLPSHSAPVTPTTPSTPTDHGKPKSRVGTGMTYRNSASRNVSRMRPPSGKSPVVAPKF